MTRCIFVVGGVMSGIGKGVTAASIAKLLKDRGFSVTTVKIDPYVNVDAGTMNPIEHGEVFVTDDGTECDQDIGTYERFLNQDIPGLNSITTGQIYRAVIERERRLEYKGRCVEVVPDIPNEVIRRLRLATKKSKAAFLVVEIGGTAGEYQNVLFLEAARLLRLKEPKSVAVVLVSYVPIPKALFEMKTKPTQQAVRMLQEAGLPPDIIVARAATIIDAPRRKKIALFCNIEENDVFSAPDTSPIYAVPTILEQEGLVGRLLKNHFGMKYPRRKQAYARQWQKMLRNIRASQKPVRIGIIGKYFASGNFVLPDVYLSVIEAVKHAAWALRVKPEITWLHAEEYEKNPKKLRELSKFSGVIVPGGFGERGVEGKIRAIQYLRTKKIPFLGLCLGLQLAVVEYARYVAGLPRAHSTEINAKTPYPVIDLMPEQMILLKEKHLGGSMRLGVYPCNITPRTTAFTLYKKSRAAVAGQKNILIQERHRHRYEVNNNFRKKKEKKGLLFSGINPQRDLVEIIELTKHPFFIATQFHPELSSRPLMPHPLFSGFIRAAKKKTPR